MSALPSLRICLAFEAPLRLEWNCMHDTDEVRLRDWLEAHPSYVELVNRAVELFREERAA